MDKSKENEIKENFFEKLINVYTTYNSSSLEEMLDDDVKFDSMWVFQGIEGKENYMLSLDSKLRAMESSNKKTNFMIMYNQNTGCPYLILTPKTPEGDFGCFAIDINEKGLVQGIHLTAASFF